MTTERRPPRPAPGWATEIRGRSPHFKQHGTLGQARAAVRYRMWSGIPRGGVIFQWDGSEWVEYERVEDYFERVARERAEKASGS